ncbi:hypothetical protein [Moellerella wisconsensis]|uniref:Uncharacterized protein n=1 Tax=Moellerella wisconsensis TaxID=158849 RepID=A0A9Q8V488_9GAMM|nr:hypothetical protein [Moellerella wisconsensis]KLN95802.1 hypothetical protein VK86_13305 [Moellerella wisconsensis]UNH23853.1 hypothetical protein MNY68_13750 [Moellerella wisconsensis]UNH30426.1 hypothetical protein MNY72_13970 [Moellerella wisconsensis]UNH42102.1 hypothetical protein MNY66_13825 [Moellerella wisconsensis]WJW81568.1 hypothetical protein QU516_13190 [Moellerella wisconsensis]
MTQRTMVNSGSIPEFASYVFNPFKGNFLWLEYLATTDSPASIPDARQDFRQRFRPLLSPQAFRIGTRLADD